MMRTKGRYRKRKKKNQKDISIKNDANTYKYIYIHRTRKKKSQLIRLINHLWHRICFCLFGSMNPYISIDTPYSDIKYEYLNKTLFFLFMFLFTPSFSSSSSF